MTECELRQSWKVQLPDYPCYHLVSGFKVGRGASGRPLLQAVAQAVREGIGPIGVSDPVTLMLLHDAIRIRQIGAYKQNKPTLYGDRENQRRACRRIAEAKVEEITEPRPA